MRKPRPASQRRFALRKGDHVVKTDVPGEVNKLKARGYVPDNPDNKPRASAPRVKTDDASEPKDK